jgi:hypothetical protein
MQPVPDHFAQALRTGRLLRNFTVREISVATAIPTARIKAFETGESIPEPREFWLVWSFLSTGEVPRPTT